MKVQLRLNIFSVLPGALLALGGCAATGPEVRADYDHSVIFAQYQTFAFANPLGTDRSGYQTMVSQDLKIASRRELEARGLRYDESSPQLLVNFNARLNDKMRVTTTPTPVMGGGYYGYRTGLYTSWPLYTDQTTVTSYTEGTLNIDVADAMRKQLIWECLVVGKVTQQTLDNLQPAIDAAVTAAFAKYPVAAPVAAK